MDSRSQPNKLRSNFWRLSAALLAGGTALMGCGKDSKPATVKSELIPPKTTISTPNSSDTCPVVPASTVDGVNLTFDYLNGNSAVIKVYPCVRDIDSDKKSNGTFLDGNVVPAKCKTIGRMVTSVAPEIPRQSDEWILIEGTPDETQFASAVYVENPEQLLDKLPDC